MRAHTNRLTIVLMNHIKIPSSASSSIVAPETEERQKEYKIMQIKESENLLLSCIAELYNSRTL